MNPLKSWFEGIQCFCFDYRCFEMIQNIDDSFCEEMLPEVSNLTTFLQDMAARAVGSV